MKRRWILAAGPCPMCKVKKLYFIAVPGRRGKLGWKLWYCKNCTEHWLD